MHPVLGFGVVGAKLDDDYVGLEVFYLLELGFVPIGIVPFFEEGATADTEVFDPVGFPEQCGYLKRIGIGIVTSGALGDAVADEGNFDGTLGKSGDAGEKCQE